jgi:hypothetical protein
MSNAVQTAVAAYLSGRNRIINGAMQFNQRQSTAVAVAGTYQYGAADRWMNVCGSSATPGVTQSIASGADGTGAIKLWLRHLVTTAVTDFSASKYWGGFTQAIEGWNVYDFRGSTVPFALSFWFQGNLPGQYTVALIDSAFIYSVVQTFNYTTTNTPQLITIMLPPLPSGASITAATTNWLYVRIGALGTGIVACPTGSLGVWTGTAATYTHANNVNWGAAVNNYIQVTDVQLEANSFSPFERQKFSDTVAQCQRYYETGTQTFIAYGTAGGAYGVSVPFKVTKRTNPTITNQVSLNSNCSATVTNYPTPSEFATTTVVTAQGIFQLNQSWIANVELL